MCVAQAHAIIWANVFFSYTFVIFCVYVFGEMAIFWLDAALRMIAYMRLLVGLKPWNTFVWYHDIKIVLY